MQSREECTQREHLNQAKRNTKNIGGTGKQIVILFVERDGRGRSIYPPSVIGEKLREVMQQHVRGTSVLTNDDAGQT